MPTSPRKCAHTCQPLQPPCLPSCAQNFSHNLTHSLAISRVSLVHLYVPLTFQRIGQRDNSYRLPAARIPLQFARCPCTQTAIRAVAAAVNHPHHTNHVNHSSNKCQPALARALTPVNPSIPRTRRDTLPPSANFFQRAKNTSIHAAIRATSRQFDTHLTHR